MVSLFDDLDLWLRVDRDLLTRAAALGVDLPRTNLATLAQLRAEAIRCGVALPPAGVNEQAELYRRLSRERARPLAKILLTGAVFPPAVEELLQRLFVDADPYDLRAAMPLASTWSGELFRIRDEVSAGGLFLGNPLGNDLTKYLKQIVRHLHWRIAMFSGAWYAVRNPLPLRPQTVWNVVRNWFI